VTPGGGASCASKASVMPQPRSILWLYDHFVDECVYGLLAEEWAQSAGARAQASDGT
jgi:hypothetical protein